MKHRQNIIRLGLLGFLLIPTLFSLSQITSAQDSTVAENTITVVGVGTASGDPDLATIEIGVEVPNTDIANAYSQVNSTIENILNELIALGIAREDIRTTGINIYSEPVGMGPEGAVQNRYRVMNRVSVTVRDLSMIEQVIDTAVASGANAIFGLQFGVSDTGALESEARANALEDARERAGQIADNIGVTLGDVISVSELQGGGFPFASPEMAMGGGAGAVVEPGQYSVSLSLQVTFSFHR